MLRILKVILEGHPCSMLPYPRMSPFIFFFFWKSWSPRDHSTKLITALNSSHLDLPSAKGNQGSKPRLASACGRARGVLLQLGNSESKLSHLLLQGCELIFAQDVRCCSQQLALIRVIPSALVSRATIDVRDDFVEGDAAWMPFRDGVPRRRWRQAPLLMAVTATQCFPSEGISRQGWWGCLRRDRAWRCFRDSVPPHNSATSRRPPML